MKIYEWINERVDISSIKKIALKKRVPIFYGTIWYYLGGVSLFLFMIQVFTGILLVLYYQPGAETAYESVKFIISRVEFGWLIREVHSWSANLFILFVFFHMFTVFFAKAYRKPREMTWISGMILLLLSLGFGFSGYLLPWNELAYFATKVGSDIAGAIPIIGDFALRLLRSGDEVSGATLTRFYGIHTALLPGIFTVMLGLHLILVQVQGMSVPPEIEKIPEKERKSIPFFPDFALQDAMAWLIVLNIIALLAVFFPWELGPKADPLASAPAGIRPEWYFMFMFQTLKYIPAHVLFIEGELFGILLFSIGGFIWFMVPFLDKKAHEGIRTPFWTWFGILLIIYMIVFTAWGYLT
ncbi:MAG: cytochrome bc complex cytochrome b subunit [Candidatus Marinimicrobia bacterium]|jgi:cytochrome b6|nr:cytochrome bc complex cytochrome b subunit [Candidatus Neomarinimicrobiota bacterium]MBT3496430.1 cytochrome bc complex cytochrome b subunit [Candidatus Neomarinimicrobiota bacterium]MBT3691790.1 cytochrome bc complex cytochrome b subunit [Candidatus Neomarinimicrobiota bacterium]MBT3732591.1 cytochrome bc complex cytochrome b subunit [Candidatus Neomarinimicrobiota bacterium]MBT4144700.1 cytochrome bc complex cytochrome b subunit [Candidatus Neomarinimicrobiota bacterium]